MNECLMHPLEVTELIKLSKDKDVCEIGSYRGGSAKAMLPLCKSLVCIDSWEDTWWQGVELGMEKDSEKANENYEAFINAILPWSEKVTIIKERSDELHSYPDNYFDLIFIDGNHEYSAVYRDLYNFQPTLKEQGGIIALHDYSKLFSGVAAASYNFFGRLPNYIVGSLAVYQI